MSIGCNLELGTVLYRILIYIERYRPGGDKLKCLYHIIEYHIMTAGIIFQLRGLNLPTKESRRHTNAKSD
jgi:hypothetical protein